MGEIRRISDVTRQELDQGWAPRGVEIIIYAGSIPPVTEEPRKHTRALSIPVLPKKQNNASELPPAKNKDSI